MMRTTLVLVLCLLLLPMMALPAAEAAPPRALNPLIPGSLDPGGIASFPWQLNQDVTEFLFYYEVTGGPDTLDVVYVSIDETGLLWQSLTGKGWAYCDCPLDAGAYTVAVEADTGATGILSFKVGFYVVPQAPVDFSGFIPANASTRSSDFGVLFPSSTSYTMLLGTTAGSYEFFVDGESQGVVAGTTTLTLELESGFHLLEVSSFAVSPDEDVSWTVQVQGQPKLEVRIVNPCPLLNPESGQSVCVTGAEVTASDGRNPAVTYAWTTNGGELNSTSSQWVQWTAPAGAANYTLTVEVSATGYVSDSDSLKAQVVPEFPSSVPLLLALILAMVTLTQRRSKRSSTEQENRRVTLERNAFDL